MQNLIENFQNRLSEQNYRLTTQRKDILRILIDNPGEHFSAEQLLEEVKAVNPDIGMATIYRNLELFCQLGIVHQLDFNNSYKFYELNIENEHHHHLVCRNCGRIIEFNDRVLEEFESRLEKEYDFSIFDHRIKFYGLCSDCRE
ncbi:MAG: Fur family transcriptional regulator [Halanaerobiaceae bacterium]